MARARRRFWGLAMLSALCPLVACADPSTTSSTGGNGSTTTTSAASTGATSSSSSSGGVTVEVNPESLNLMAWETGDLTVKISIPAGPSGIQISGQPNGCNPLGNDLDAGQSERTGIVWCPTAAITGPQTTKVGAYVDGHLIASTTLTVDLLGGELGLDKAFGDGGRTFEKLPGDPVEMVRFADGSFMVIGRLPFTGTTTESVVLSRFTSAGKLDTAFGSGGSLVLGDFSPTAATLDPNDRVVIVGTKAGKAAAARFNGAGLDAQFGSAAEIALYSMAQLRGVTVDASGRILIVGDDANDPTTTAVTRLLTSGNVDPSFGAQGISKIAAPSPGDPHLFRKIHVLTNGIVVAGVFGAPEGAGTALAKLGTNGALDMTYGTGGIAEIPDIGDAFDTVALPWGGVLVVGDDLSQGDPNNRQLAASEITAQGALDPSFQRQSHDLHILSNFHAKRMVAAPSGGWFVFGAAGEKQFGIVKLTASGALDMAFGKAGRLVTHAELGAAYASAPVSAVLDGDRQVGLGSSADGVVLVAYKPDGAP